MRARASKRGSLRLGPAGVPDSGRGDGAELPVTPARASWRTSPPSRLPRGAREKLPQAAQDFAGGSVPRAQCARSTPSAPRARRRSWVGAGRGRTPGWGMGAHTAASNPSPSVNTPGGGWAGGAPRRPPRLHLLQPTRAGAATGGAGAAGGRALAGAGPTAIGRGRGRRPERGCRAVQVSLRSAPPPGLELVRSPDPCRRRPRRRRWVSAVVRRAPPLRRASPRAARFAPIPPHRLGAFPGPAPPNV